MQSLSSAVPHQQQQFQIGESVPSAITSVYCKLHKYAYEGKKSKLKQLLKENKGKRNSYFYSQTFSLI